MLLLCDTERHCQRRRSDRQAEYLDIDRLLVLCIQRKAHKKGARWSFADGLRYAGNGNLGIDEFRLTYLWQPFIGPRQAFIYEVRRKKVLIYCESSLHFLRFVGILRAKSLKTYQEKFAPEIAARTSMADFKKKTGL